MSSVQDVKNWLSTSGRNWDQLCQALMWQVCDRFGSAPVTYSSAIVAYRASTIVSRDPMTAPSGAIHYWDIGVDGHVALELGGGLVLMGSKRVSQSWGVNVGTTTVSAYTSQTGARYLGWSRTNGRNSVSLSGGASSAGVSVSDMSQSWVSWSAVSQLALQTYAKIRGAYTGPLDSKLGVIGWTCIQTALFNDGLYNGVRDGIPGAKTFAALQTLAKRGGYAGPVDSVVGPATLNGVVKYVASLSTPTVTPVTQDAFTPSFQLAGQTYAKIRGAYTGPLDSVLGKNGWVGIQTGLLNDGVYGGARDGVPGTLTYKGMQMLASRSSVSPYKGPVDGVIGNLSMQGFINYVKSLETPSNASVTPVPTPVAVTPQSPSVALVARPTGGSVGVDVATPQRDMDFTSAVSQGAEFFIVKASGLNVLPQYVAPYYTKQIDSVVALNKPKGHYYLIGKGETPEQQATFFVNNLHKFDKDHDVLMLDNEVLDGNGAFWLQADIVTFVNTVITLTGVNPKRVWVYMGANDTRSHGPWNLVVNTGARFVWAAYGSQPKTFIPDHEPDLKGSIPEAHIHQSSSSVPLGGVNAVDALVSKYTVVDLFNLDNKETQVTQDTTPVSVPPATLPPIVVTPVGDHDEVRAFLAELKTLTEKWEKKIQ